MRYDTRAFTVQKYTYVYAKPSFLRLMLITKSAQSVHSQMRTEKPKHALRHSALSFLHVSLSVALLLLLLLLLSYRLDGDLARGLVHALFVLEAAFVRAHVDHLAAESVVRYAHHRKYL
jgi:hypothetical protein